MAVCISLLIALVGFICLKTLPIEQYPDIAPPTVMISTSYSGADANTVMKSVVMPIEEAVNGVENMAYMTSEASAISRKVPSSIQKKATGMALCSRIVVVWAEC